MGGAGSAANIQRALWPRSGTTTVWWWASCFWFRYAPNAWPRVPGPLRRLVDQDHDGPRLDGVRGSTDWRLIARVRDVMG